MCLCVCFPSQTCKQSINIVAEYPILYKQNKKMIQSNADDQWRPSMFVSHLPLEIWEEIGSHLPLHSYSFLRLACKRLHAMSSIATLKFPAFKESYAQYYPSKKSMLAARVRLDHSRLTQYQFNYLCSNMYDTELMRILTCLAIPFTINPSYRHNYALRVACGGGESTSLLVVNKLLADLRVDPADFENHAIRSASEFGRADIVARLLQDERINPATCDNCKSPCIINHQIKC